MRWQKEEMQTTRKGCHAETGTESRCTHGVQTCMGIAENNLVEVPNVEGDLLTHILSPMLSNIMLNELDKELTKRGHPFVRYADDCMIFCRSERAAGRILESISKFIEGKLFLKVNRDKTDTGSVCVYGKDGRIQGRG